MDATEYKLYLSDTKEKNFRYAIYPRYKESRARTPRPVHYQALKDYLIREWGAVVTPDQEADDALGIDQTYYWSDSDASVICSIDKDLLQVPGNHYNWVKNEFQTVDYLSGLRSFYEQCLKGDRTDDVLGLQGIGDVKARKALASAGSEQELFQIVRDMWKDDAALLMTARLLWVRRYPNEMWEFPLKYTTRDMTQKSLSSRIEQRESAPLSEHGSPEKNGAPELGSQTDDTSERNSLDWI